MAIHGEVSLYQAMGNWVPCCALWCIPCTCTQARCREVRLQHDQLSRARHEKLVALRAHKAAEEALAAAREELPALQIARWVLAWLAKRCWPHTRHLAVQKHVRVHAVTLINCALAASAALCCTHRDLCTKEKGQAQEALAAAVSEKEELRKQVDMRIAAFIKVCVLRQSCWRWP